MAETVPIGAGEAPKCLAATRRLVSDDERTPLVDYPACNPTAGDLSSGTGKLWGALEGRGKCDGARMVYFHHEASMPLFALTAYAEDGWADLSQQHRDDFLLVETFKRRR